jgi:hypothetical protein
VSAGDRLSLHVAHEIMVDEINAYIVQTADNTASVNAVDAQQRLWTYAHIYSTQYTCAFYRVSEHNILIIQQTRMYLEIPW